ncbi:NlpC/P60 family protein [Armatimonas sp.]|uniref:C40 family peptidase n=1 Tax=Armatimonas sp. TaxID=1872638 RepID=UPI0037530002
MKKFWVRLKAVGCLGVLALIALLYFSPALREFLFRRSMQSQTLERQETTRKFFTMVHLLPAQTAPTTVLASAATPSPVPLVPSSPMPTGTPVPQATPEPTPGPPVIATPEPAMLAERTADAVVIKRGEDEIGRFTTLYKTDMPGGKGPAAVSGAHAWWATKELLFHGDLVTKKIEVFLPYAGAKGEITALKSDDEGVSVTTSSGQNLRVLPERHVWKGFIRAPLGPETEEPGTKHAVLKKTIDGWIGTPYVWGGDTKQGIDCSGLVCQVFNTIKISLPRTSKEQATVGKPATDELRWGDLLCYEGHVSIYVGNGRSAEALGTKEVGGTVKYATIWHRPCTGARRVLP